MGASRIEEADEKKTVLDHVVEKAGIGFGIGFLFGTSLSATPHMVVYASSMSDGNGGLNHLKFSLAVTTLSATFATVLGGLAGAAQALLMDEEKEEPKERLVTQDQDVPVFMIEEEEAEVSQTKSEVVALEQGRPLRGDVIYDEEDGELVQVSLLSSDEESAFTDQIPYDDEDEEDEEIDELVASVRERVASPLLNNNAPPDVYQECINNLVAALEREVEDKPDWLSTGFAWFSGKTGETASLLVKSGLGLFSVKATLPQDQPQLLNVKRHVCSLGE